MGTGGVEAGDDDPLLDAMTRDRDGQRGRGGRRFQFHDQRQRAGQRLHDFVEGGHHDAAITPRKSATMIRRKASAGVVPPERVERLCCHGAAPAGGPVDRQVVHEQQHAVARYLHVELDGIHAERDRLLQRLEGVLRGMRTIAAMSDYGMGAGVEQNHRST